MREAYIKVFSGLQVVVGILLFSKILMLLKEYNYILSLGEIKAVYDFAINGLVWVVAGLALFTGKKLGWKTAISIYTVCLIYQSYMIWHNSSIQVTESFEQVIENTLIRMIHTHIFQAVIFLVMVVVLFLTRKLYKSSETTTTSES